MSYGFVLVGVSPGPLYVHTKGVSHRLFQRVILHKLCIIKINLCIFECQTVYL